MGWVSGGARCDTVGAMAHPRPKSPPERLGDVLQRWLKKNTDERKITQYTIRDRWQTLVGDRLASCTRPAVLHKGVLTVYVSSSSWLNELSFMRADIVRQINEGLGRHLVAGIRLRSGRVDALPQERPAAAGEGEVELTTELVEELQRQTEEISDPDLRKAILGARLAELRREPATASSSRPAPRGK